jgi:integrase
MTVRKHGNNWQAQVRLKGHKPESRSFPTQKAAEKWKRERTAELRSGITGDGGMTLGELLREYRTVATSSSHAGYLRTFLNACPFLDVPVSKITEAHWIAYRDMKLKTQKKHSYSRCLMPIRGAIRYAIEMKRWSPSVFDTFQAGKIKSTPTKRRKRLFKEDERELLACARNAIQDTNRTQLSYPVFKAIVTLLLETAMRVGEVMILTKRHIRSGFII